MNSVFVSTTLGGYALAAAGIWLGICVLTMLVSKTPRTALVALLKALPLSILSKV